MKRVLSFSYFFALIIFSVLLFSRCSQFQIPDEVCTYGGMVCETGSFVCDNYQIPDPICSYFNIACTNLNLLCSAEYGSDEYKTALLNLKNANVAIQKFLDQDTTRAK